MGGTELFANDATTTVVSGGTSAPVSGTVETWTVASSAGWPGASSASGTQFHVADLLQVMEKILVTDVSGTTWTVTRGAEGTTPVPHAAGFTVRQVVTAGFLGDLIVPIYPSGDTSGAADTAILNGALSALPASGGKIFLAAGTFYLNWLTIPFNAIVEGSGLGTVLMCVGTPAGPSPGVYVYWHLTSSHGPATYYANPGGLLRDLVIDGSLAPAGMTGLHFGDAWKMRTQGVRVQHFNGTGSVGVHGSNDVNYTEKGSFELDIADCTQLLIIDGGTNAGTNSSWEYNNFDVTFYATPGTAQNGVLLTNGAYLYGGGLFRFRGNFNSTGTFLTISGQDRTASVASNIGAGVEIQLNMETNNAGPTPPTTITFGTFAGNTIKNVFGSMVFGGQPWTPSNVGTGALVFGGIIQHDANLIAKNQLPSTW